LSLKGDTREAVILAYAELQNAFFFFPYQKKPEVSLHGMFEIQTVDHYIKGFLRFVLWLLVYGVVLMKLELLVVTTCS